MIERLSSVKNPVARRLRLLKHNEGRAGEGLFLVEGGKLIREALDAGLRPRDALIERAEPGSDGARLIELLEASGARAYAAPRHILEAVCDTVTPSGVCASFEPPEPLSLERAPDLLVALDGVQDPGNVGTIWRTADAAGFGGLIAGAGCADLLSPKVQRAAMGSGFRLPAASALSLADALKELKRSGRQVIATTLDGEDIYHWQPRSNRLVVVIGSEARGVSEPVLRLADARLKLPMRGGAESLNAAVAAGIVLYELMRR